MRETRLKQGGFTATGPRIVTPQPVRLTLRAAIREVLDDYRVNRKRSLVDVQRRARLHLEPFFGRRYSASSTSADRWALASASEVLCM